MIYGDTISFGPDFNQNRGLVAEYLLWDIMTQLECPTGNAVLPLPVSEALRIPSAEEIVEAQCFGRRIEQTARRLWPHIDFTPAYDLSANLYSAGKSVFNNAIDGLKEAKININDPIQILYVLKMLGPADFEEMFGMGKTDQDPTGRREPLFPTDIFELSQSAINEYRHIFDNPRSREHLEGHRFLIASTDVHAHAVTIIHELLSRAGAKITNMGAEINPDQIAKAAKSCKTETILLSTHNGMALEYANRLKTELDRQKVDIPVVMGGVLNQKVEGAALPVDVTVNLKKLGFHPVPKLGANFQKLLEHQVISK
jgi:methylmalonyl-CoA mutase cobalamin-binding subunit